MSRLVFRLQPIPTASGSVVRLDTASGSNTPADIRTLGGNVIDGAIIRSGPHAGGLPSVLGPDGVTTLYQKTLDYRGQVTGSPVTLTGEDDNPSAPTGGTTTTDASLLTSGTLSAARLPNLSGTYAPVASPSLTGQPTVNGVAVNRNPGGTIRSYAITDKTNDPNNFSFPARIRPFEPTRRLVRVTNRGATPVQLAYSTTNNNSWTTPAAGQWTAGPTIPVGGTWEDTNTNAAIFCRPTVSANAYRVEVYTELGVL